MSINTLGRAGVPLEVMGLMLGEFVDEYTINVVDVFACPQYGTDTSVETADEQFQADMIQLLKQTERYPPQTPKDVDSAL